MHATTCQEKDWNLAWVTYRLVEYVRERERERENEIENERENKRENERENERKNERENERSQRKRMQPYSLVKLFPPIIKCLDIYL